MDERPGLASRVVFIGLAVSLALALGVAFYIYVRYVRYEPVAALHVPAEFDTVVHVSVQQAVVYEPFRKHLLHLFEAGRRGPESRLLHLERKTTLELGVDSREAAFGFGPEGRWVIAMGGLFRRQAVVAGAQRMLKDEGIPSILLEAPERLRVASGAEFAVAEDGTLLLAQSASILTQALGASAPQRPLAQRGTLGSLVASRPGGWPVGGGRRVLGVRVQLRAADGRFPYEAHFEIDGAGWEQPLDVFEQTSDGPWALPATLGGARSTPAGPQAFVVSGELDRAGLEVAVARLAFFVRQRLALPK